MSEPKLLTTAEVAERLQVSRRHVQNLISTGRLRATPYGRMKLVREEDLALLTRGKVGWKKGVKRSVENDLEKS